MRFRWVALSSGNSPREGGVIRSLLGFLESHVISVKTTAARTQKKITFPITCSRRDMGPLRGRSSGLSIFYPRVNCTPDQSWGRTRLLGLYPISANLGKG